MSPNSITDHRRISKSSFETEPSQKEGIAPAKIVSKEEAQSKSYRLLVCSHVLEHVPWPLDVLSDIKKAMDCDSVLYIELPFEELMRRETVDIHKKKKHWHEHINFFGENSLRHLIKNAGLEVIELRILHASAGGDATYLFQVACRNVS